MLFLYDTEILYLLHGLFENNIALAFLIAISIFFFHPGGIGMGKTCKLKDVSFQCMTKFTTN